METINEQFKRGQIVEVSDDKIVWKKKYFDRKEYGYYFASDREDMTLPNWYTYCRRCGENK